EYYRLREKTTGSYPLCDALDQDSELIEFLGGNISKLALLHLKFGVINATAAPSDPRAYVPAIKWLKQQGYRPVLIGRERVPQEFADLGVLNYAESAIASYR